MQHFPLLDGTIPLQHQRNVGMKYLLPLVALTFSIISGLFAQSDSNSVVTPEVFVTGGLSYPYLPGTLKDSWKTGWNSGVGYGVSFAPGDDGYGTVYAGLEMARFAFDPAAFRSAMKLKATSSILTHNASTAYSLMLNFKGTFSSFQKRVSPYFLIGIGFSNQYEGSIQYTTGPDTVSRSSVNVSTFAWSAGIGLEVPLTESVAVLVQAKSILGVTDPTRQYFPVSAGVRYRFH
jgi:opacity protein-like surface antigen